MMRALLCGWLAICPPVTGTAVVQDGDTITIDGNKFRLYGIDAEELNTMHGRAARSALIRLIGASVVTCVPTKTTSHHRIVAKCSTPDIPDLGREMVKRGYALDCYRYSFGYYRSYEAPDARSRLTQAPYC